MAETKDGGPAFPQHVAISPSGDVYGSSYYGEGLSLRDWFAGQALVGLIASNDPEAGDRIEEIPWYAYSIADAMIAARTSREASDLISKGETNGCNV